MDCQDLLATPLVRPVDQYLPVEASRAQQRRIEDLGPVGRAEQAKTARWIKAVELGQELVQGLLLLVMPAADIGATGPPECVEFVDEDDRRRVLARLLEEVAHPRRADADEHLDEFRAGDRKERHPGLAGDRTGKQCLAGPRRA